MGVTLEGDAGGIGESGVEEERACSSGVEGVDCDTGEVLFEDVTVCGLFWEGILSGVVVLATCMNRVRVRVKSGWSRDLCPLRQKPFGTS